MKPDVLIVEEWKQALPSFASNCDAMALPVDPRDMSKDMSVFARTMTAPVYRLLNQKRCPNLREVADEMLANMFHANKRVTDPYYSFEITIDDDEVILRSQNDASVADAARLRNRLIRLNGKSHAEIKTMHDDQVNAFWRGKQVVAEDGQRHNGGGTGVALVASRASAIRIHVASERPDGTVEVTFDARFGLYS